MTINLQATYGVQQAVGYAGAPATMHGWDADSYIVDKAGAVIPFGVAVSIKGNVIATGTERSIIIGGTAAMFAGVTYRDITMPPIASGGTEGYPPGWVAGVMTRGDMWVTVTDAVAVGDVVKFVTATGVFAAAGTILLPHARWMRGAAAGGLAILRLGQPNALPDLVV